ncbi:MAG: hypothetical protein WC401_12480 [Bacteroidales bacterium]
MNLKIDLKEDAELRAYIKDLIRGQIQSVLRKELKSIIEKVVDEKGTVTTIQQMTVDAVARKLNQDQENSKFNPMAFLKAEIKKQISAKLYQVFTTGAMKE